MTGIASLATAVVAQATTTTTTTAAPAGAAGRTTPADPATSFWATILPLLPFFVLFYLLFMRPQRKQELARQRLIAALKRNDKVLTGAGIYGTVMSVEPDGDKVVLRIDDDKGVKMTVSKGSIVRVEVPPPDKDAPAPPKP